MVIGTHLISLNQGRLLDASTRRPFPNKSRISSCSKVVRTHKNCLDDTPIALFSLKHTHTRTPPFSLTAGPLARDAKDVAKHVRKHVEFRQKFLRNQKPPRVYESLEKAVKVRCMTATTWPGNQYLSEEASREMVQRGSIQVPASEEHPNGGIQFVHDPRLQMPSLKYFVTEQVEAVYADIQCPTALFLAVDGWPFDEDRKKRTLELLKPVVCQTLPGSHHFHADPGTAPLVVDAVAQFLQQY